MSIAHSTIKLYQNTNFYPNQNYKIDSIEDFLTKLATTYTPLEFNNVQYFRPLSLNKEIKLTQLQKGIKDFHKYNYAKIQIINEDATIEWTLYYFVIKVEWISSNAVKLTLQMDTLNTFMDSMVFSPRTMVEREHIDRWDYNGYKYDSVSGKRTILRSIPYTNEGLNPSKYCYVYSSSNLLEGGVTENKATIGMSIYNNSSDVLNSKDQRNYISYYYYSSSEGKFHIHYLVLASFTSNIYVDFGSEYGGVKALSNLGNVQLNTESSQIKLTAIPYIPDKGMNKIEKYTSSNPLTNGTLVSLGSGLKTNIIQVGGVDVYTLCYLPSYIYSYAHYDYAPIINDTISIPNNDDTTNDITFSSMIRGILLATFYSGFSTIEDNHCFNCNGISYTNGYDTNESSLFSSEFFDIEFFMDKSNYHLALEDFEYIASSVSEFESFLNDKYPLIKIQFYPSLYFDNTYSFKFRENSLYFSYIGEDSTNFHLMIVTPNNQIPMFDDAYKNYMRNVYNYDLKLKELNRDQRRAGFGIGMIGKGIIGGVLTAINPVVGGLYLARSGMRLFQQTADSYYQNMKDDLELEKKQAELKAQKVGIEGVNGALEHIYRVNPSGKLSMFLKAPNRDFWKTLGDYFYYYGNKVRQYKVPTHNNRALFDYLKCEADFVNRNNVPNSECYNDMLERLKNGITYIHKYLNTWTFDTDYKENVENGLLALL